MVCIGNRAIWTLYGAIASVANNAWAVAAPIKKQDRLFRALKPKFNGIKKIF
jgi:hypothetical protein